METKKNQPFYCEIIKEEPLSTLEPDMTDGNTCVLESTSPFFGYYQDAPMGKPDPYIYCVLEQHHSFMEVFRAASKMNAKRRNPVDVASGYVVLQDKVCPVIRLKNINHFNQVQIVQQCLKQHGMIFKKRQRTINKQMGIIHLAKLLYLLPKGGEGIYMDACDSTKAYFEMPGYLSWEDFKKLTTQVRYDTSVLYFDAAQASIIRNEEIIDLVRVYRERVAAEQLKEIRDRYHQLMR